MTALLVPARPADAQVPPAGASGPDWTAWQAYFAANADTQRALEALVDWGAPLELPVGGRARWLSSLQRFQLGESGDGAHLLGELARGAEVAVLPVARAFVAEEGSHSRLLRALLERLEGAPIERHWSDAAFVAARRFMGVATELSVIAVAESVALVYYGRLADAAPDPVVRAVARRILSDEEGHVPFVASRVAVDLARWSAVRRVLLRTFWWAAGAGGVLVLVVDHSSVLRDCGTTRLAVLRDGWASVRSVRHEAFRLGRLWRSV